MRISRAQTIALQLGRAGRRLKAPLVRFHHGLLRAKARLLRRGSYVKESFVGSDPCAQSNQAAVYVSFDKNGIVHDYVIHQLQQLVAAGFRITFVSNSPSFPARARARLSPFCKQLIWRHNVGHDFGAYKDGIASIAPLGSLDALLLMNDSVYGPFCDIRDMVAAIDRTSTDFWGIADSWEHRHHLQTFFMLFFPGALQSAAFTQFWAELPYVDNKWWVVLNGEVGLSQTLQQAGLRPAVLAPYWSVHAAMKSKLADLHEEATAQPNIRRFVARIVGDQPVNPMQYFWDVLITDFGCPFIKKDLLSKNPAGIPFVEQWPAIIAGASDYDIGLIEKHLRSAQL
ncbi:MAG TPA: rhamnan synthesis F family protein [Rhodopseudomonas sp.]|uniref:rhamnan synthesis F family protein n=1 Tax=Rhodopseudomonas sp. TaxID=1078 RepID=UPI002EDA5576